MRALPILTGVLTIAILGAVGTTLISGGQTTWGAIALAFAALRLVLLVGQVWRRYQDRRADEQEQRRASEVEPD